MKNIFLTTQQRNPMTIILIYLVLLFSHALTLFPWIVIPFFAAYLFFVISSHLFLAKHIYTSTQHPKKIMCDPTSQLTYLLPSQKPDIKILTEHDIKKYKAYLYTKKMKKSIVKSAYNTISVSSVLWLL